MMADSLKGDRSVELNGELFAAIFNIILIDIILGGDNAVVIALACRKLPSHQRNKAIIMGTGLAIILRVFLTAIMVSLMQMPYLLLIGGLLLIYIAYKLLSEHEEAPDIHAGGNLFSAIKTIVIADLVMGLDNILGIAGASKGNVTLVAIGLLISVPIIIWGSKLILAAMEQLPILIYIGGAVLAYTAAGMITGEPEFQAFFSNYPKVKTTLYVLIVVGVLLAGWIKSQNEDRPANKTI